jgi:hypothetical protein
MFFIRGWPLAIPLAIIPLLVTSKRARLPLAILGIYLIGLSLEKAVLPHYFGPAASILILLLVLAIHRLRYCKLDRTLDGRMLIAIVFVCFFAQFCRDVFFRERVDLTGSPSFLQHRHEVIDRLERTPGSHLVLVHYGPTHSFHEEWIYNHADIDGSKIVWAHDNNSEGIQPLLNYYPDRAAWCLDPDGGMELKRIR